MVDHRAQVKSKGSRLAVQEAQITELRSELQVAGVDTTGEDLPVPAGFIRVMDLAHASRYFDAGHSVKTEDVKVDGRIVRMVLVSFGKPSIVANRIRRQEIYPKPGETPES